MRTHHAIPVRRAGENEACVRYVLDRHACMRLVPAEPRVGGPGLVGRHPGMPAAASDGAVGARGGLTPELVADVAGEQWLTEEEAQLVQRFSPHAENGDSIGFFVAVFVKES